MPKASVARRLRVVTINTGKGDGQYACRLALLADGLTRLDPDIVLLQESFIALDGSAHTARFLADRLGMQAAIAPARRKLREVEGRTVDSESGLAVLSRWMIRGSTTLALPSDPEDGDRIAQFVT